MNEMQELYQEIILDHNKRPRNYRLLNPRTHEASGHNPLCGDELSVSLNLTPEGRLAELCFQGEGCAISKASASLMTVDLKGKSRAEALARVREVLAMLTGTEEKSEEWMASLGDLASLSGVRRFPARVKCATLAWHALEAALAGQGRISTE